MRISAVLTSIPAQKYSHIVASTMSKRWVAAGCGDKGSDRDQWVSSGQHDKTVIKEDVRGTVHTAQESVCQNYSGLEWCRFLHVCPRKQRFSVLS